MFVAFCFIYLRCTYVLIGKHSDTMPIVHERRRQMAEYGDNYSRPVSEQVAYI